MIPAIGFMIAAYTIARLAQVFVEHSEGIDLIDRNKRMQLISVLAIVVIVVCGIMIFIAGTDVDETIKTARAHNSLIRLARPAGTTENIE